MKCKKCGNVYEGGFCPQCGTKSDFTICTSCGTTFSGNFCPKCGQSSDVPPSQAHNSSSAPTQNMPPQRQKKKSRKQIIIGGIIAAAVMFVALSYMLFEDDFVEANIETVKNGYLGEYTDMTIEEFLGGYYSGHTATWNGGTTDDGENIVEVIYTQGSSDSAQIQFTMLDDQVFEINAFVDSMLTIEKASDLPAELNNRYLLLYLMQHESEVGDLDAELALIERLDQISGSAVLYGASADYTGDRTELYSLFEDTKMETSVSWLLDNYGYLDMSYYTNLTDEVSNNTSESLGDFSVEIGDAYLTTDLFEDRIIIVSYNLTNNSEQTISAAWSLTIAAFQDGIQLEKSYSVREDSYNGGMLYKELRPGVTAENCQEAFILINDSPIEFEVTSAFTNSKVLKEFVIS